MHSKKLHVELVEGVLTNAFMELFANSFRDFCSCLLYDELMEKNLL